MTRSAVGETCWTKVAVQHVWMALSGLNTRQEDALPPTWASYFLPDLIWRWSLCLDAWLTLVQTSDTVLCKCFPLLPQAVIRCSSYIWQGHVVTCNRHVLQPCDRCRPPNANEVIFQPLSASISSPGIRSSCLTESCFCHIRRPYKALYCRGSLCPCDLVVPTNHEEEEDPTFSSVFLYNSEPPVGARGHHSWWAGSYLNH